MNKRRIGLAAAIVAAGAVFGIAHTTIARADQPHMQIALHALQNAEHQLAIANEDKGGHRVKALEDVRAAIAEVQMGIGYDRRH